MASHCSYDKSKLLNKPYKTLHDVTFASIISLILWIFFIHYALLGGFFFPPVLPTQSIPFLLENIRDTVLSARNTLGLLLPLPGQVLYSFQDSASMSLTLGNLPESPD